MDLTVLEIDLPEMPVDTPLLGGDDAAPGPTGPGDGGTLQPLAVIAVVVGLALLARYLRRSDPPGGGPPSA